jgi:hypothetical protein
MRMAAIALIGSLLTIPAILPANAQTAAPGISQAVTTEFSAATGKKKAPKKMKKEKVEYMRSAAPPEPKK